ncbi:MAG: acetaldehyde dehydrogenase (acetylating) [Acidobacteriia bacterium]|nr:acetaldehyde dehydrogenase (acetylating) [Terriglobia bacterium]
MTTSLRDADLLAIQEVRDLLARAVEAQKTFAEFSQEKVDAVVAAMARAAQDAAVSLAKAAHEETGFGNVPDKTIKNQFCCINLYEAIKDMKTVGILRQDHEKKIWEVASPLGVVAAVIPSTNPTSTTMFKALISVKARNAVVISPHPSAKHCIRETTRILGEAARGAGAPDGILGCLTNPTLEATQELMSHRRTAVILATGGHGLVKAAYSSGRPAFGVGPGNVPAYIEQTANVAKAVRDVINGKTFDYGTLCSSEQSLICDEAVKEAVVEECKRNGAYFLNDDEIAKVSRTVVTEKFTANPMIVGKPAPYIAEQAGFHVPSTTRVLIAPLAGVGRKYPLSIEKLSPVLSFYVVKDWREGCERCVEVLNFGGLGHTLALHCNDESIIREFALRKPVFRLVVNTLASIGAVGATTGLFPSMTLGCGAPGGNITSDNISPMHLINIRRVAFELREYQASAAHRSQSSPVTAVVGNPDRELIASVIDRFLASKGALAVASPGGHSPSSAPNSSGEISSPEKKTFSSPHRIEPVDHHPVDFVSEADVRRAIESNEKIAIHGKTIITPAARDLAESHDILVRV